MGCQAPVRDVLAPSTPRGLCLLFAPRPPSTLPEDGEQADEDPTVTPEGGLAPPWSRIEIPQITHNDCGKSCQIKDGWY